MTHESLSKTNSQTIPAMLYGTAWKEQATAELTCQALQVGFEGIDTANQRKHYFEEGVGQGIQMYLKKSDKSRSDLFLQTKFTFAPGQDERKPFHDDDPIEKQVLQSFTSSLEHLQTDYIDSYILHGPYFTSGLCAADWEAWGAMERLVDAKKAFFLGISNVSFPQLELLCQKAVIKPTFVQNRCFANSQWDKEIRGLCKKEGIIYQGFSLLTANYQYLLTPFMQSLAKKYNKTIPQIIFCFALQKDMLPLTGTTNQQHMREDLEMVQFKLDAPELEQIENIALLR
ncbi:aldo/keto reductase family protein [Legionella jamestowniensis]|uniref:Xylose reductase n=1 Tax=Legionella jamestowniensis TaxID=455 RepID=A0A0W0UKU2_9GAMM|nr:aldo/keto reductase [Legionella jamestowniensis]KTD08484.1 D-xylose reductase III [Legionella jamestowniensis]OCH97051.1 xylose reductase [Legionella jamestowniensis]SFL51768.1 Aldo/keto reductase [Legionella jamestowniensis DSM 19215]